MTQAYSIKDIIILRIQYKKFCIMRRKTHVTRNGPGSPENLEYR